MTVDERLNTSKYIYFELVEDLWVYDPVLFVQILRFITQYEPLEASSLSPNFNTLLETLQRQKFQFYAFDLQKF